MSALCSPSTCGISPVTKGAPFEVQHDINDIAHLAHSSDSTTGYAMELGYHLTLVRDATAAFTHGMMHAAHDLNGLTFAHAIPTTTEMIFCRWHLILGDR